MGDLYGGMTFMPVLMASFQQAMVSQFAVAIFHARSQADTCHCQEGACCPPCTCSVKLYCAWTHQVTYFLYGHFYRQIYGKIGACVCSMYQAFPLLPLRRHRDEVSI